MWLRAGGPVCAAAAAALTSAAGEQGVYTPPLSLLIRTAPHTRPAQPDTTSLQVKSTLNLTNMPVVTFLKLCGSFSRKAIHACRYSSL